MRMSGSSSGMTKTLIIIPAKKTQRKKGILHSFQQHVPKQQPPRRPSPARQEEGAEHAGREHKQNNEPPEGERHPRLSMRQKSDPARQQGIRRGEQQRQRQFLLHFPVPLSEKKSSPRVQGASPRFRPRAGRWPPPPICGRRPCPPASWAVPRGTRCRRAWRIWRCAFRST